MKNLFFILLVVFANITQACPGCAGSMSNPKDSMLVWILCGFIALIYIPFYILYRTIIKNRHLNEAVVVVNEEE
ncbi:hypothetical protein [Bacteriovorax sp. Seq25_V]|uniref:hypothetical protein n=1 Tax=Bacteriovorax sp. Seq25_V TaxID=1201288 RepID=UPI000389F896|nr:hypothetical protein [Bacteriovorax sp. Seq25_V]EQC43300.1 hypothetical protein M900_0275 [Bacteriovorax sp. Seq25_V]